LIEAEED